MASPYKQPASEKLKEICPQCGRVRSADAGDINLTCQCSIRPARNPSEQSVRLEEAGKVEITADLPCEPAVDLGERYRVLSMIGMGGSAKVYKVRDTELDRTFAVKVLDPKLASDEPARKRFAHEAEASINMTHPNLVAVYGHGLTSERAPYLVMDCLEGETLAELLKREKRLDVDRALGIFQQISDALIHTHLKGIVHRDLKPSNIFISRSDDGSEIVKVVDFGIARDITATDCTRLTQTGDIIGSPLYMSPEQCKGEAMDARSDIYSLGCVMYEVLSGVSPFAAENPIKTIIKHIGGTVPEFRQVSVDCVVPGPLESVVHRCLEKNPNSRYQNVDEVLNDLRLCSEGKQKVTRPHRIQASVLERFAASVVDGLIISAIIVVPASLTLTGFPFPAHFFDAGFPLLMICMLQLVATIFVGPFLATVLVLTNNSAVYSLSGLLGGPLPTMAGFLTFVWLYTAILESSPWQATIGKRLFGIRVVNEDGGPVSFWRSSFRFLLGFFTVSLVAAESFLQMLKRNYLTSWAALSASIEDMIYLLKNPPTDRWSKTRVVVRGAINNPFLPNLKEHLQINDLIVRPSAGLKAVRNQMIGMTVLLGIVLFANSRSGLHWISVFWIFTIFGFFGFPWLLSYGRLKAIKKKQDGSKIKEAMKKLNEGKASES